MEMKHNMGLRRIFKKDIGNNSMQSGSAYKQQEVINPLSKSIQKALGQMQIMIPVILGVILLVGLFQTFISKDLMSSLFTGIRIYVALLGAAFGSVLTGNPANSYVIGKGLLDVNVGVTGVASFIVTWVTVGLAQIPAEAAALGLRFAIIRAAIAFAVSIPIACFTSWFIGIV